ncbi:MAG: ABC transporter ATP-binding protein [Deltaproteobacteria bacterium]|nr:MAG: ABC transporter ATP-binding protein [Deltaproteobacteria bacterium]
MHRSTMQSPALEVRGLTRTFGRIAAVSDLELTVNVGDVYGFLGPNGAGKTTAIRCMLGLIRRDSGTVRVFGESDLTAARRHVGAIVETPAFHAWMSGTENLRHAAAYAGIPRGQVEGEIARVLDRVGLTHRAIDSAGTYSLGMKQRLGIARALLGRPRLLVLDEPTNGLDPRGMAEMRQLIRSLARNEQITIFISSHLLAEVQQMCNRVGILSAGRLKAEGRVEELLQAEANAHTVDIDADDQAVLLAALDNIEGIERLGESDGGRIRVRTTGSVAALNRQLVEAGVAVNALVPSARNLEEVFLEVTT